MCATDEQTLRTMALDNAGLLLDSGLSIALPLVKMKDKEDMVKTVALHQVLLKTKAEMNQFSNGLKALGILDSLQQNPHLFRSYFMLDGVAPLTAGICEGLYNTIFTVLLYM